MAGTGIFKYIRESKENGFEIHLYYVGVNSAEIAKERIAKRVLTGGHGISDATVDKRYVASLETLPKIIPYCDFVEIYDNTNTFNRILKMEHQKIVYDVRKKSSYLWINQLSL